MVFGVILAGGVGSRMGNVEKPKQFLKIGGKPILIHTVEKFLMHDSFQELIVLTPTEWIEHTKNLLKKYLGEAGSTVKVLKGGSTRNETIMNSIAYIEEKYGLDDDTLIVTHDSVRPFLTYRIIEENIKYGLQYGACDTVIPATDTIVHSEDGKVITSVPDRSGADSADLWGQEAQGVISVTDRRGEGDPDRCFQDFRDQGRAGLSCRG